MLDTSTTADTADELRAYDFSTLLALREACEVEGQEGSPLYALVLAELATRGTQMPCYADGLELDLGD